MFFKVQSLHFLQFNRPRKAMETVKIWWQILVFYWSRKITGRAKREKFNSICSLCRLWALFHIQNISLIQARVGEGFRELMMQNESSSRIYFTQLLQMSNTPVVPTHDIFHSFLKFIFLHGMVLPAGYYLKQNMQWKTTGGLLSTAKVNFHSNLLSSLLLGDPQVLHSNYLIAEARWKLSV